MQCVKCGVENGTGSNFCNGCGESLQSLKDASPKSLTSGIGDGERRRVTAMFADVVDSTPLAERIGEEALYKVMQEVIAEMSASVADYGGTIEKLTGDGLMALFGAPLAIEDAPLSACRAGLDILERIKAKGDGDESMDETLQIRVGINTGYAVVGSLGGDLQQEVTALGDAVNVAARLEGLAKPGTLVVGEATYQLVRDFVSAEFAGEHTVKGKTDAQKIWRIDALNADASRFSASVRRGLTKLVGREHELETLLKLASIANLTKARGINISGDAGLGKSRLVHEFRQRTQESGIVWLQGNCSEIGRNTPFLPFIDVVRSSFRVDEKENEVALERRLKRGLERLGLDPEAEAPYLLNLLGVKVEGVAFTKENSEIAGLRTRDLLARLVVERGHVSPVILHIEDLHWIDAASEALLLRLMEESRDLPILALFTYRPGYTPPWEGTTGSSTIALKPLSSTVTEALLRARMGADDVPAKLVRLITDKAEGNPLFTEEIINYLSERGDLSEERAGEIGLPVSLENLLMARVDRLGEGAKAWLQVASVIGRNFDAEVVTGVAGGNGMTIIEQLQRMELIHSGNRDGELIFKHALIQDAVYNSLLSDKRATLHERIAETMEARNLHRLGEIAETLAHHYAKTPRTEKAVRYLAEAGQKSLMVYSLDDAYLQLRKVVELVEEVPDAADDSLFVDVLLSLARALYFRMDMRGIIQLLTPHISRAEALGDPSRLSRLLFEIGYAHVFGGNLKDGYPLLDRADAIGKESGNELITGHVAMGKMWAEMYFSNHDAESKQVVEQYSEKAERIGRAHRDHWLTAKALVGHSLYHTAFGRPDEARRWAQKLFELTRETNDPRPRTMALWALALLEAFHFAPEEAESNGHEGAQYALSLVDQNASLIGQLVGWVLLGRSEEAAPIMRDLIEFVTVREFTLIGGIPTFFYGLAMMQMGNMAVGEKYIMDAIKESREAGKLGDVMTGNLLLGEIYTRMALGIDTPPLADIVRNLPYVVKTVPFAAGKARKRLNAALEYTRKVDAPSFTAWATYNLGRLDQKKKRHDAAKANFDEARSLARSVELDPLVDMIDAAASA